MDTQPQPAAPERQAPLFLRRLLRPWALALLGAALGASAAIFLVLVRPVPGELELESEPSGAEVSLEGRAVGRTPLALTTTHGREASYQVVLTLDRYHSLERRLTISPGRMERLTMALEPLPARLALESAPPGANIRLDGREVGHTPAVLVDLPPGRYEVALDLGGYAPGRASVDLEPGGQERRLLRLEPLPASIEVTANVPGARVLLEGAPRGEAPLSLPGLPAGSYEVRVEKTGLVPWTGYLWLSPGESRRVEAELAPPAELIEFAPPQPERALAIVVENHPDARPQAGLHRADVVYEALAEGGISRFLALYLGRGSSEIGPVRSARHYHVAWAREYDATLAHIGASPQGYEALGSLRVTSLDGRAFWRSNARPAPHNAYTGTEALRSAVGERAPAGSWGGLKFKDPEWRYAGPPVGQLTIDYGARYRVAYAYESETNTYLRSMAEAPHRDAERGRQLSATSVVVMTVPAWVVDSEGRLDMALTGNGRAHYFLDGIHLAGAWRRETLRGVTTFLRADGEVMRFNPGPLWIQVVPAGARLDY